MLTGPEVARLLADLGFTDVVWIPDSYLGTWEAGLLAEPRLRLVRATREGEALALAAGLILGGRKPMTIMQCTGLFEAGDALRNVAHDLKLPLRLIVGVRSGLAAKAGPTVDTCPPFVEPFLKAWQLPFAELHPIHESACRRQLAELDEEDVTSILLIPE